MAPDEDDKSDMLFTGSNMSNDTDVRGIPVLVERSVV